MKNVFFNKKLTNFYVRIYVTSLTFFYSPVILCITTLLFRILFSILLGIGNFNETSFLFCAGEEDFNLQFQEYLRAQENRNLEIDPNGQRLIDYNIVEPVVAPLHPLGLQHMPVVNENQLNWEGRERYRIRHMESIKATLLCGGVGSIVYGFGKFSPSAGGALIVATISTYFLHTYIEELFPR